MKKTLHIIIGIAAGLSLAACGAGTNGAIAPSNPAPLAQNALQLAVGTANLFGTTTGLNVVATYRQSTGSFAPGDSGALVDSPTLNVGVPLGGAAGTGAGYDGLSTILTGPSAAELGGNILTSSSQNPGTTTITSFGQSGGVFGLGIEPFNETGPADATSPSTIGIPFQVAPYPIPLLDANFGKDPNALVPWGGPPAFSLTGSGGDSVVGNSNYPKGTAGVSEGIDVLQGVAATAGATYSLGVSVPANSGPVTTTQTFTLPAATTTIATPVNPAFTPDGSGGGAFAGFALPANATEAYVEVIDYGPATGTGCNGASAAAPLYYTLETNSSALPTLPDAIGPNGAPSTCTAALNTAVPANAGAATPGDQVTTQVVAFDYPAFESSYPTSLKNPTPTILGNNKSDDIAISAASCTVVGGASCTASLPLLRQRQFAAAYNRIH